MKLREVHGNMADLSSLMNILLKLDGSKYMSCIYSVLAIPLSYKIMFFKLTSTKHSYRNTVHDF